MSPKLKLSVAAVCICIGLVLTVVLFFVFQTRRWEPGRLGPALQPVTVQGVIEKQGAAPLALTLPHEIQKVILEDSGAYCGTDQISVHLVWQCDRDALWHILVGTLGSGDCLVPIGQRWELLTSPACRSPNSNWFSFPILILVNQRPAYAINLWVSKREQGGVQPDVPTRFVWTGPFRLGYGA
jgi:hypothetical protein